MCNRCFHVEMLHKSLSVCVSTQVLRYSSSIGCYKRLAVIDRFLSLVTSCGSRTVKAPLLIHGNRESAGLNNLTLNFQLSWEWNQGLSYLCLVLGILVFFFLINLLPFSCVDTSILYLVCHIWERFDLKCGTCLICTELGWCERAYVGPLLNAPAATTWSRRTSSLHGWLIKCIKCLFRKNNKPQTKPAQPKTTSPSFSNFLLLSVSLADRLIWVLCQPELTWGILIRTSIDAQIKGPPLTVVSWDVLKGVTYHPWHNCCWDAAWDHHGGGRKKMEIRKGEQRDICMSKDRHIKHLQVSTL